MYKHTHAHIAVSFQLNRTIIGGFLNILQFTFGKGGKSAAQWARRWGEMKSQSVVSADTTANTAQVTNIAFN